MAVRGLPPLPPSTSTPIQSQSTNPIESVEVENNKKKVNKHLESFVSNRNHPDHYSTLENIRLNNENSLTQIISFGLGPSKITLQSQAENTFSKDLSVDSCRLNVDRIVFEGTNLLELKPELKKIILGASKSEVDSEFIRKEFQTLMSNLNTGIRDSVRNRCKDSKSKTTNNKVQSIEAKVLVNKKEQSDSSDDSEPNTSKPEVMESTPDSSSKKNLSVRFQGPSPQPPPEQKKPTTERRRRKKSHRRSRNHYEVRRGHDGSSTCSTCSSSSSSDDESIYQLPPRRAYGGVRISYVPNDALAVARQRQAANQHSNSKKPPADKSCTIS